MTLITSRKNELLGSIREEELNIRKENEETIDLKSLNQNNSNSVNESDKKVKFPSPLIAENKNKKVEQITYNLWAHDEKFSKEEVILNPDFFPNIQPMDLIKIYHPKSDKIKKDQGSQYKDNNQPELIIMVSSLDKAILAKQPLLQLSISNSIANSFSLKNRISVVVEKVEKESVTADYVEIGFKDQYLGRNDMWRLKMSLINTCVHLGKKITYAGCIRVQIKNIFIKGTESSCGYINKDTKLIFRSESARYYLFIQMSKEMWEFEEDGYLYLEKAMDGFLPDLMERWKKMNCNHIVSIILFSRIYYDEKDGKLLNCNILENGKYYKDFYKVVIDWETKNDWLSVIKDIKNEFVFYQKNILLNNTNEDKLDIVGYNSNSSQGNILEALNLALNGFDKHYVDRDLIRTGLCVMVVTPGNGIFEVDKKLLRMTFERMNDNGISLDLVCLSKQPYHLVPLFQFKSKIPASSIIGNNNNKLERLSINTDNSKSFKQEIYDTKPNEIKLENRDLLYLEEEEYADNVERDYYALPHWVETSFYNSNKNLNINSNKEGFNFVPRCKMPSLQNIGIHGESKSVFPIPYLNHTKIHYQNSNQNTANSNDINELNRQNNINNKGEIENNKLKCQLEYESYDAQVFMNEDKRKIKLKSYNRPISIKELNMDSRSEHKLSPNKLSHENENQRSFEEKVNLLNADSLSLPISRSLPRTIMGMELMKQNANNLNSNKTLLNTNNNTVTTSTSTKPVPIVSFKNVEPKSFHTSPKESINNSFKSSPISENIKLFSKMSPKLNSNNNKFFDQQILLNPCINLKSYLNNSSNNPLGRWRHVFIKPNFNDNIKWISLCSPACLPLTTDFFPSLEELSHAYEEYTYTVSPSDEYNEYGNGKNTFNISILNFLKELISQRLAQEFQLVVFDDEKNKPQKVIAGFQPTNDEPKKSLNYNEFYSNQPTYLSMGNHIHRLTYDPAGQNIEVKRYVRRINHSTSKIDYKCLIWPKTRNHYLNRDIVFNYPNLNTYNWNYLDHLISGYQEEITEGLRFWRARFVLLPSDIIYNQNNNNHNNNLDEEEIRLSCFCKFLEQFQKVMKDNNTINNNKKGLENSINQLNIQFTTLTPAAYLKSEARKNKFLPIKRRATGFNLINIENKLNKDSKLGSIAQVMQSNSSNLKIENRRWHSNLYENCMVGNEIVDFILRNFKDINTREEAVKFGELLINKGLLQHIRKHYPFLDGHFFYQFTKEYSIAPDNKPNVSWFRNTRLSSSNSNELDNHQYNQKQQLNIDNSNNNNNLLDIINNNNSNNNNSNNNNNNNDDSRPVEIPLSYSITIDLDPTKKSSREEVAYLHYDSIYNINHAYHFQIHWLGCTSKLIDDLLQSWSRAADKCNLKLVETSVNPTPLESNENPFHTPILLKYSLNPPNIQSVVKHLTINNLINAIPYNYFSIMLLKKFDFILDIQQDDFLDNNLVKPTYSYNKLSYQHTQFMHKSGTILIQILEDHSGLLIEKNRLNNINTLKNCNCNPDGIINNLVLFCNDSIKLNLFWLECIQTLKNKIKFESILDDLNDDVLVYFYNQFQNGSSIVPLIE